MQVRVPVVSESGKPLMPTTPARARKWIESGKAVKRWSDVGLFYVQLNQPAGNAVQPITVGIDPGKHYSGIAVQSARFTLFTAHLILSFKTVKDRMEQRRMMRRGRRGRRINRKIAFYLRAHRQKRFDNRKGHKIPPSIRANRQLELRVVTELYKVFPITQIVYEYVKARTKPGCSFSPVQVGQRFAISELSRLAPVSTQFGYEIANLRTQLGLVKCKDKSAQTPESHAVDGIALASSYFVDYEAFQGNREKGYQWNGSVDITPSPFFVIRRPPISRRQLHLMVPAKGGVRRRYGGTTTRHGARKGDFVQAEKSGEVFYGWVSGDTKTQISVSDVNWRRIAQFTASKVRLIRRSNGLIVSAA